MRNNSSLANFYLNATQKTNSLAVQLEVLSMSLHPYSREQKLQQIESLHRNSVSRKDVLY
ncbi:MAG: hypothetical protein PUK64_00945 [bacterium]|nr:hypothetical protein [bacterium]